jgi:hypothetical protein
VIQRAEVNEIWQFFSFFSFFFLGGGMRRGVEGFSGAESGSASPRKHTGKLKILQ